MNGDDQRMFRLQREFPGLTVEAYAELLRMEDLAEQIKYEIDLARYQEKQRQERMRKALKRALKQPSYSERAERRRNKS